jgi:tRNA (guanine-N7-)-methyltransferase
VGKNKLARWAEMKSFSNVIEPSTEEAYSTDHPLKGNWKKDIFKNDNPVILELGCGKGEYTVRLASKFHGNNYIGIDIKGARMWRGSKTAHENQIHNSAFLRTRIEFINSFFSIDEVEEIWITFPDPHPKRRNSAKRLTSPFFLNSYRSFLKDKGIVHLKTDNRDLYDYTYDVIKHNDLEIIASTNDLYSGSLQNEIHSIRTHYENIFLKEGKKICYLAFCLEKNKVVKDVIWKSNIKSKFL